MSEEEWRPVVGWEGYYSVSSFGRVRSERRVIQRSTGPQTVSERILRSSDQKTGHQIVSLSRPGEVVKRTVHRLVLEAFRGPRPEGMEGCHSNGDPRDNRLENLRWDTRSSNRLDAVRHGTHFAPARGRTSCPRGHRYFEWNNFPYAALKGRRVCRACSLSRRRVVYRQETGDYYRYSDEIFEELKSKAENS